MDPQLSALSGSTGGRQTAHRAVLTQLRRAILTGELAAGTHLVQADVAATLGVSTTPVREALRDLAGQGLVQLDTHRGAVVRRFDQDDMREIFEMRLLLEPFAVRKRIEAGMDEDLPRLKKLQARMAATKDAIDWLELNAEFHRVLADVPNSPRLREALQALQDGASVYLGMTTESSSQWMKTGNKEHEAIIAACEQANGDRASKVVLEHLESTVRTVLQDADAVLQRSPAPRRSGRARA
jgi:DNA-binding GntR family transcriptional regulator